MSQPRRVNNDFKVDNNKLHEFTNSQGRKNQDSVTLEPGIANFYNNSLSEFVLRMK